MRVERLVIEAGESTFTLDLHPRLTVVAGMGHVERRSLIGELIGALGGSRAGVHVELEQRDGRHLAVFRPTTGAARVVDVDRAVDVTGELGRHREGCDLLGHIGLTIAAARRIMCLGAADLAADSHREEAIEVLAGADQSRVWAAAEALVDAERDLAIEAEALGSAPEDAAVIDEVERRHAAVERAAERFERTRRHTFWIGGVSAGATLPGVVVAGARGMLFLVIAVVAVIASLVARWQVQRAERAEEQALADAGASSYLGFQLHRVNGLLGDDTSRQILMDKAERRRTASARWQQVAGDIPVEWALVNREEITAAARLRRQVDALGALSSSAPEVAHDVTDDLAHVLVSRLARARAAGGEGLPLVLDDPFREVDPSVKPMLLELLGRSSDQQQILLLTDDEDVASWARLEALTGELVLVEPAPEHGRDAPHRRAISV